MLGVMFMMIMMMTVIVIMIMAVMCSIIFLCIDSTLYPGKYSEMLDHNLRIKNKSGDGQPEKIAASYKHLKLTIN